MSDIPTYLSCILNEGKFAIGQGLTQAKKLRPHSFVAGDAYNFVPTEDGVAVSGNVVYTGGRTLITGKILSKDTFKHSLVFPETSGPFTIGNVILYLQSDDGIVFPFIWVALKIPYPKVPQVPGTIGNRYVFEFIEKIINVDGILDLDIVPAEFFSLASYTNEAELPPPESALFQHFVVHEPLYSPHPFIGARRAVDNTYWGLPLPFRVGDPFFGILDGGRAAEPKTPYMGHYYWGGRLSMKNTVLTRTYGGGSLTTTPVYNIGGEPLPANPGYTYP